VRQWLAFHRGNHSVMPPRNYSESVRSVTSEAAPPTAGLDFEAGMSSAFFLSNVLQSE